MLGVLAAALFYGDAMITPAISVLSAVEGLSTVDTRFTQFVIPIAIVILVGLFLVQARGTARMGAMFGPVVLVYLLALGTLGVWNILQRPEIRPTLLAGDRDLAIELRRVAGKNGQRLHERRKSLGLIPTYKIVDTCAAEFEARTPYFYSCYEPRHGGIETHDAPQAAAAV